MKLRQLLNDNDAVSPVIGVILMVAITVILAAVIATFVLGLGEQVSQTSPNASFSFDYEEGGSGDDFNTTPSGTVNGNLTITHAGGPNIDSSQVSVAGTAYSDAKTWGNATNAPDEISAGTSLVIEVTAGETVSVTWENDEGTESSTLQRYDVP